MELIKYLMANFLTKDELLKLAGVSETLLRKYQQQRIMPKASYRLKLDLDCDSFFGTHGDQYDIEFYSKGYTAWLGFLQSELSESQVYEYFAKRYLQTIEVLNQRGHSASDEKLNAKIEEHIKEEWGHFISGTYGLCTKSGLPEDIASKELAIAEINQLTSKQKLEQAELEQLTRAVNLLDSASSLFAPHERDRSSRYRLVDEVRRQYQLTS